MEILQWSDYHAKSPMLFSALKAPAGPETPKSGSAGLVCIKACEANRSCWQSRGHRLFPRVCWGMAGWLWLQGGSGAGAVPPLPPHSQDLVQTKEYELFRCDCAESSVQHKQNKDLNLKLIFSYFLLQKHA